MRITTKGRYGLRAVLVLAIEEDEKPVPIRYIAEKENLSPEFLEQIFFRLKKAGIIFSTRGAGGGFKLNKRPEEITILEIMTAVGEDINLSPCDTPKDSPCDRIDTCKTTALWQNGTNMMRDYFASITLSDAMADCVK
ncbi:MAG: Rrf2 family transcriptional regulator [Spirochaetales bacterium]|nr:Rrf2 family transcriptional regulator [Spirochaetales bacterium]